MTSGDEVSDVTLENASEMVAFAELKKQEISLILKVLIN
jgi:DNA repair protein RecN (Recombination protein N)